jgi:hypothetical protein
MDPEGAYQALIAERKLRSRVKIAPLDLQDYKARAEITAAKEPFLEAIIRILNDLREFWPVSERQIHYNLLNEPPLKHASKPNSRYQNDHASARALSELVTRARIAGLIDEDAIDDETRPIVEWRTYRDTGAFIEDQLRRFMTGYWRQVMQSQPNHIELLVEKNTIAGILNDVAGEVAVPMTSGRGFASYPPRAKMRNRFHQSGKNKLVIIIVSDFDPAGEAIAESFARSMRDDFEIEEVFPIKAALTHKQVTTMTDLPPSLEPPKPTGKSGKGANTHYPQWLRKYGRNQGAYELEALAPAVLQRVVRETIDSVIDHDLYNADVREHRSEVQKIAGVRKAIADMLKGFSFDNLD